MRYGPNRAGSVSFMVPPNPSTSCRKHAALCNATFIPSLQMRIDQTHSSCFNRRLGPAADLQLAVYVLDELVRGVARHAQRLGDLGDLEAIGAQGQGFVFAWRQFRSLDRRARRLVVAEYPQQPPSDRSR